MIKTNPVLGIIGGGQLGSMLATSAKKLNIKTVILSDDPKAPAKNFCDKIIITIVSLSFYLPVPNLRARFVNGSADLLKTNALFF